MLSKEEYLSIVEKNTGIIKDKTVRNQIWEGYRAAQIKKDINRNYKMLKPVVDTTPDIKNTGSKKGIGWSNFKRLVSESNIPVFALGGMLYDEDINTVKCCGAIGVASTSNFYNLFNA